MVAATVAPPSLAYQLAQSQILQTIAAYDGHMVGASRTGSGKTTTMLASIANISFLTQGAAEFFCASGKASLWMGLEQQVAHGLPRVINVSLSNPESIEPLLQRLRWAVATQEQREQVRLAKQLQGQKPNFRPYYFVLDEWLIILSVAKAHGKESLKELIRLVEALIYKGRQDKCYLWLFGQGHQCKTLGLSGDTRRNLGVLCLGGDGNYQTLTAAITDSDLIEDKRERIGLSDRYNALTTANNRGRYYYTSIGGHKLDVMDVLPDMEALRLFEPSPDFQPQQVNTKTVEPEQVTPEPNKSTSIPESPEARKAESEESVARAFAEYLAEKDKRDREDAQKEAEQKVKEKLVLSEARWNLITLLYGCTVFAIYVFPPFSGAVQASYRTAMRVGGAITQTANSIEKAIDYWSPNLQRPPESGDKIAGQTVAVAGNSVAIGGKTSLYAIGMPGDKVDVKCEGKTATYTSMGATFRYTNLNNCAGGSRPTGSIIANGVTPSISQDNQAPITGYAWWALTGNPPQPVILRGGSASGSKVAQLASTWKGKEFKPGQTTRCADFVRQVLKDAGVNVGVTRSPWDSGKQPNNGPLMARSFFGDDIGFKVDPQSIQPGDIVGFTNTYGNWGKGAITHVGIAVSSTEMVDRPTANAPVKFRSIFKTFPNSKVYVVRPSAYK